MAPWNREVYKVLLHRSFLFRSSGIKLFLFEKWAAQVIVVCSVQKRCKHSVEDCDDGEAGSSGRTSLCVMWEMGVLENTACSIGGMNWVSAIGMDVVDSRSTVRDHVARFTRM
jgi:hypothetical protein